MEPNFARTDTSERGLARPPAATTMCMYLKIICQFTPRIHVLMNIICLVQFYQ